MSPDFEGRVRTTGKKLYSLIGGEKPSVFRKEFWAGRTLEWCMRDEGFKTEMFRFVDVFPYLNRPESVVRHMQEYFGRPGLQLPQALRFVLEHAAPESVAARMMAMPITRNIESMARQFIAGADAREALPALERLRARGIAFTVDLLGEAVVSEEEADRHLERNFELLEVLDRAQRSWKPLGGAAGGLDWGWAPRVSLSVKPSALYSQFDPIAFEHSIDRAKERLRPLIRKVIRIGASLTLDMEHRDLKGLTLGLYRSLLEESEFGDYPHTGIALQAYLKESRADLETMIEWARARRRRFTLRLVKGAYWDSEVIWARQRNWPVPVFTRKHATDASFEELTSLSLRNHDFVTHACASHNLRSIAFTMETASELRVPAQRLEYQVLYGMGEPIRNALRKAGLPVRLYVPVGELVPGMAYLVRRLLENTSNESFLTQAFHRGASADEMLRSPAELGSGPGPAAEEGPAGSAGPPSAQAGERAA
ncbi:MAG: proline dehydrogenase family protein, partial [bacterium]